MATLLYGKALIRSFLPLVFIFVMHLSIAGETETLPLDQDGKVEYHGTVFLDDGQSHTISNDIVEFLNTLSVPDQLSKEVEISGDMQELKHQFGFYLYHKPGLTRQIDGVILADITVKVEEDEFEYHIYNFRFIQYARDRFGKFTPRSTKKYPLELYYPDSKKKTWQCHFVEINRKIAELEQKMNADWASLRKID